jgi:hypothetical protein
MESTHCDMRRVDFTVVAAAAVVELSSVAYSSSDSSSYTSSSSGSSIVNILSIFSKKRSGVVAETGEAESDDFAMAYACLSVATAAAVDM